MSHRLPTVGTELDLRATDDAPSVHVTCFHSYGTAVLMAVRDADGGEGIVAFQPDGSWWWVRELEKREPWESPESEGWR